MQALSFNLLRVPPRSPRFKYDGPVIDCGDRRCKPFPLICSASLRARRGSNTTDLSSIVETVDASPFL